MTNSPKLTYINHVNDLPAYSLTEASRILRIPVTTIRAWIRGQVYRTKSGERLFRRVVIPADSRTGYLSFTNLIELSVLGDFRRKFGVRLRNVRSAIEGARRHFGSDHPLADFQLLTDKTDVLIEQLGEYLNLSDGDQLEMKTIIHRCLLNVEKDTKGIPRKFFPVGPDTRIEIDPRVNFGRPSLSGTGIATEYVFDRFRSGEDADTLAADYRCDRALIVSAIQFEEASRALAA